jgi:hypothetical protein
VEQQPDAGPGQVEETEPVDGPQTQPTSGAALPLVRPPAPESADDPAAVAAMREERAARRLKQTVRDMVISMIVVGGAVVLLVLPFNRPTPTIVTVDPAPVVASARDTFAWPVLAPEGLAATWRPTSARFDTAADGLGVLHLGYLSPSTYYVGLEQSATKETAFVRDVTFGGVSQGTTEIGGVTWERQESADGGRRSLVRRADGAIYVVTGPADWAEIDAFARALVAG